MGFLLKRQTFDVYVLAGTHCVLFICFVASMNQSHPRWWIISALILLAEAGLITGKHLVFGRANTRRPDFSLALPFFLGGCILVGVSYFVGAGPVFLAMIANMAGGFALGALGILDIPLGRQGHTAARKDESKRAARESEAITGPQERKKSRCVRFAATLALPLAALGLLGWVGGALCGLGLVEPPPEIELPPGGVSALEVGPGGRLYMALAFYGRVQAYEADGSFIRGWQVPARGGRMKMVLDPEGSIRVAVERGNHEYTYSMSGELLNQRRLSDEQMKMFGDATPLQETGPGGSLYQMRGKWLGPRVVRKTPGGLSRTVTHTPFYLWVIMAPLPAAVWTFVGLAVVLLYLAESARATTPVD